MKKYLLGAAAAAGLAFAAPSYAAVVITDHTCAPGSGCANVHLVPDAGVPDNVAYGTVGGLGVTFTGIENIQTSSDGGGLPWVTGYDADLTYLDVALTSGDSFTLAGFNLNDLLGNGSWFVKISAFDGATLVGSHVFQESHNTQFKIAGTGGDAFTHFQIQLVTNTGGLTAVPLEGASQLDGVGQIRIGGSGIAVPEPATWAMMLMGFGGMGAVLRRNRRLARMAFA